MFEPFTQEHGGARSEYKGTGLSLSITKQIIDRMGGTIRVESEPNVGATFIWQLTFPLDKDYRPQAPAPAEEMPEENLLNGMNILAAEDNELNAEILKFMLEDDGANVTLVETGTQELEAFRKSPIGYFGLVLTDILMPEMDGYEASKAIRALNRPDAATVPIVAISANSSSGGSEKSCAAGINAYISKPVNPDKLKDLLHKLLKK